VRKGKIRWETTSELSDWYDLGSPMPEYLKSIDVIAVHVQEEMSRAEYEAMIKEYKA
jgi:hypothetical protein